MPSIFLSRFFRRSFLIIFPTEQWTFQLDKLASGSSKSDSQRETTFNPFAVLIRLLGTTLTSLEAAPIRINSLVLENAFGNTALFSGAFFVNRRVCSIPSFVTQVL